MKIWYMFMLPQSLAQLSPLPLYTNRQLHGAHIETCPPKGWGPMCYFREIWASTGQTDARPSTGALTVSTLVSAFKVIFLYEFVSLSGTNISKYDNASVWQTCSYSLCDFTSSPWPWLHKYSDLQWPLQ